MGAIQIAVCVGMAGEPKYRHKTTYYIAEDEEAEDVLEAAIDDMFEQVEVLQHEEARDDADDDL